MKVAIASGKGGTGKTFVSTNLFYTLQDMGTSVLLTDCDAEVPNSMAFFPVKRSLTEDVTQYLPIIDVERCVFCGECVKSCVYNAIFMVPEMKKISVLNDLCHGCGACEVVCPNSVIRESNVKIGSVSLYKLADRENLVEGSMLPGQSSPVPIIKMAINRANKIKSEFLILDAPPGTSCPFVQTVVAADYVILVTEPTPFGLSDLRQAVNTLKTMNLPFGVIINRAGIGNSDVYQYLKSEKISLLAEIPFDKKIAKLYSEGDIVAEKMPEIKQLFEVVINKLKSYGSSNN